MILGEYKHQVVFDFAKPGYDSWKETPLFLKSSSTIRELGFRVPFTHDALFIPTHQTARERRLYGDVFKLYDIRKCHFSKPRSQRILENQRLGYILACRCRCCQRDFRNPLRYCDDCDWVLRVLINQIPRTLNEVLNDFAELKNQLNTPLLVANWLSARLSFTGISALNRLVPKHLKLPLNCGVKTINEVKSLQLKVTAIRHLFKNRGWIEL